MNVRSARSTLARGWGVWLLGVALPLAAQTEADAPDVDTSPYHRALLQYKSGKYEAARMFIDNAEKEQPGNVPVELLKARILVEQRDFEGAKKVLAAVADAPDLKPNEAHALSLSFGDLALRQHHFDEAAKSYETALAQTPGDADITLKLVYAKIGASDLVAAGRHASELKPLDPSHPAYYFARAALARNAGNGAEEEQNMEQARTIYGITITNSYLKTYLEVFGGDRNAISNALNPPVKK